MTGGADFLLALLLALTTGLSASQPAERTTAPPASILAAPEDSSCPQWYAPALDAGWRPEDWRTLDRVMYCESRCDPNARNGPHIGLLQINRQLWADGRDLYDPATNLVVGTEVLAAQGWRAWQCY